MLLSFFCGYQVRRNSLFSERIGLIVRPCSETHLLNCPCVFIECTIMRSLLRCTDSHPFEQRLFHILCGAIFLHTPNLLFVIVVTIPLLFIPGGNTPSIYFCELFLLNRCVNGSQVNFTLFHGDCWTLNNSI